MLEGEGFSGAECWRMKGSQGRSAVGCNDHKGLVLEGFDFFLFDCNML